MDSTVKVVIAVFFFAMAGVLAGLYFLLFAPWLRAMMSGLPIDITGIVGMRLRRLNVKQVLDALILATQSGFPVASNDMQRAALKGVELEKVTLAYIAAKRQNLDLTFADVVESEQQDRLTKKLRTG